MNAAGALGAESRGPSPRQSETIRNRIDQLGRHRDLSFRSMGLGPYQILVCNLPGGGVSDPARVKDLSSAGHVASPPGLGGP